MPFACDMRTVFALFAACLVPLCGTLAQDAEPLPEKSDPAAAPVDPFNQPLQLIPESPAGSAPNYEAAEELARQASELREKARKPSETQMEAEKQRQRTLLRQTRTKAERNAAVREAWDQAEAASTDAERRYALKQYYNRLYDQILKLEGSLKGEVEDRRKQSLSRLEQTRLRPSVWPGEKPVAR